MGGLKSFLIVGKCQIKKWCGAIKTKNIQTFISRSRSSISIRSRATVSRGAHLPFNPLSEEGDPAVDSIFSFNRAAVTPAIITNEDMLIAALVSERTSRVSLA